MSEMFRRRIRVEGGIKDINGFKLTVHDADTGEEIRYVSAVDIHTSATSLNTATVTYHEHDETGKLVVKDGEPVMHTGITDNPEVAVTALETMSEIEQLRAEVKMHREANIVRLRCWIREEQSSVIQAVKDMEEKERKARERQEREARLRKILRVAFERVNNWPGEFSCQDAKATVDGMMQAVHEYMQS